MRSTVSIFVGILMAVTIQSARAQDFCDVVFQLDDAGPFSIIAFSADYSTAGAEFVGDSSIPEFGGSWGTEPLACTVLASGLEEATLLDGAGDLFSVFLADLEGLQAGTANLLSCVLALDSGFPCPSPAAFSIIDAVFPDDPIPPPIVFPPAPGITVSLTPRTPVCGDSFIEGTEQCDDGNTDDGDCCSSSCQFDVAGTPCADTSVCTSGETCDGAGTCTIASTLTCDDGVFCTRDFCDDVLGCQSASEPTPHGAGCANLRKTKLVIRDHPTKDSSDRLKVKARLSGNLGDPAVDTNYAVCVFDEVADTPSLAFSFTLPAGAPWQANGAGFSYKDPSGINSGIEKFLLKANNQGTVRMTILGKGDLLPLPGPVDADDYLNSDSGVTLQIENDAGECWTERFRLEPRVNKVNKFVAKE